MNPAASLLTVVKCGGGTGIDADAVAADVADLVSRGRQVVLLHGGASDIEGLGRRLGATARTITTPDGEVRRYTDAAAMEVVTLALAGLTKPRWVAALAAHGVPAVGLTGLDGGCITARRMPIRRARVDGRVRVIRDDHGGTITGVATDPLRVLLDAGYVPVLSPPARGADGAPVNVNADRAAAAVAGALSAAELILLTEAPGLLRDPGDEDSVLAEYPMARGAAPPDWARGGMAMKLLAAREALEAGVPTVTISDGRVAKPVHGVLDGDAGTRIVLAREPGAGARAAAEPPVVDLLHDMLAIPSPSRGEQALAGFLERAMNDLGLSARRDAAGNVIATTGRGDGPTVLLVGHMDTTPGPTAVRREGDRLYGRGAADAQGPLAALIAAAAARRDFPGTLVVAGVVEEETPQSRGANHLAATLPRPDALVVAEPGFWDHVVIGYKGKIDVVYRATRPATHPTNPAQKATEAAAAFWNAAQAAAGPDLDHASFDTPGLTLCAMSGDITQASVHVSYRTPVGFDDEKLLRTLRAAADGGEVELENSVPAVRAKRSNPVVRSLLGAIRARGGAPRTVLKTATSDMNTLAQVWDCPMATYGPGDNRLGHADDEYIGIDDLLNAVDVLGAALDGLAEIRR